MECDSYNLIDNDCNYSTPNGVPTTALKVGNDFPFYGVTGLSGVTITENTTNVIINQDFTSTGFGLFMNLGPNLSYMGPINVVPTLTITGPNQFNIGMNNITVPVSTSYTISWCISHIGQTITAFFETISGTVLMSSTYTVQGVNEYSMTACQTVDLVAGEQYRFRLFGVQSNTLQQFIFENSYLSIFIL